MKYLLVALLAFAMSGCAGQLPSICDDRPDSVLCDIAASKGLRLETVADILMVINLRAIKQGAYTKADARAALSRMQYTYHMANFTAADLKMLVFDYVDDYPELILMGTYIGYFDSPAVLKPKDIEYLDGYINQQLWLLQ